MNTFTYRDPWAMNDIAVEADKVTFEPGHVAFWEQPSVWVKPRLVLAVLNKDINGIREEKPDTPTFATKRPAPDEHQPAGTGTPPEAPSASEGVHEFIDKTAASDDEWQKRLELFEAGLSPLCRNEYEPGDGITVYCAASADHAGAHRSLNGRERW